MCRRNNFNSKWRGESYVTTLLTIVYRSIPPLELICQSERIQNSPLFYAQVKVSRIPIIHFRGFSDKRAKKNETNSVYKSGMNSTAEKCTLPTAPRRKKILSAVCCDVSRLKECKNCDVCTPLGKRMAHYTCGNSSSLYTLQK